MTTFGGRSPTLVHQLPITSVWPPACRTFSPPSMADTGESQPEPSLEREPASSAELSISCYICLEDGAGNDGGRLLHGGCACRGGAGFVHLSCAVLAAKANRKASRSAGTCQMCKQRWTGELKLGLARAHSDEVAAVAVSADCPEEHPLRLDAAIGLSDALKESGSFDKALHVGSQALKTARLAYGDAHSGTLRAMSLVASVHAEMGNLAAALAMETECLTASRSVNGNEHARTLTYASNLATSHMYMGNCAAAVALAEEVLDVRRRISGPDQIETLICQHNCASFHSTMGNFQLALPLMKDVVDAKRKVFGGQHRETLLSVMMFGDLCCNMGNHAGAAVLLEEALAGLTVLLGPEHSLTVDCKTTLTNNAACLADPVTASGYARWKREERLRKNANLPRGVRKAKKEKPNAPCACGSGKKHKKCCMNK